MRGAGAPARGIIVVEGFYDYLLVRLLALAFSGREEAERLRLARLGEVFGLVRAGGGTVPVVAAEGREKLVPTARLLAKLAPGLPGPLVVLADSDEEEPAARARRLAGRIGSELRGLYGGGARALLMDKYVAAVELEPSRRGPPRLRVAAWRCSGECWLSLLVEGCEVTSVEECPPPLRRRCHSCLAGLGELGLERLAGELRGAGRPHLEPVRRLARLLLPLLP